MPGYLNFWDMNKKIKMGWAQDQHGPRCVSVTVCVRVYVCMCMYMCVCEVCTCVVCAQPSEHAHHRHLEWSPDSRSFVSAALRPWRNVDNGYCNPNNSI